MVCLKVVPFAASPKVIPAAHVVHALLFEVDVLLRLCQLVGQLRPLLEGFDVGLLRLLLPGFLCLRLCCLFHGLHVVLCAHSGVAHLGGDFGVRGRELLVYGGEGFLLSCRPVRLGSQVVILLDKGQSAHLVRVYIGEGAVEVVGDRVDALTERVHLCGELLHGLPVGLKSCGEIVYLILEPAGLLGGLPVLLAGFLVLCIEVLQLVILGAGCCGHALCLAQILLVHGDKGRDRCGECCNANGYPTDGAEGGVQGYAERDNGRDCRGGCHGNTYHSNGGHAYADSNGCNSLCDDRVFLRELRHKVQHICSQPVELFNKRVDLLADGDLQVRRRVG